MRGTGTNCKCKETAKLTGGFTWCLAEIPLERHHLLLPHCKASHSSHSNSFFTTGQGAVEMASSQLHFHPTMNLAFTIACSQTLPCSCPVPPWCISLLSLLQCPQSKTSRTCLWNVKNVSPSPWKPLGQLYIAMTLLYEREKYVHPKTSSAGKSWKCFHPKMSHCCLCCQ